jgi:hypothetical protein
MQPLLENWKTAAKSVLLMSLPKLYIRLIGTGEQWTENKNKFCNPSNEASASHP